MPGKEKARRPRPTMEILQRPKLRNGRKFEETSLVLAGQQPGRCDLRHSEYVHFSGSGNIRVKEPDFGWRSGLPLRSAADSDPGLQAHEDRGFSHLPEKPHVSRAGA